MKSLANKLNCLNPKNIPDLIWKWADTINTQDIGKVTVSHIFYVDDLLTQDVIETILMYIHIQLIIFAPL